MIMAKKHSAHQVIDHFFFPEAPKKQTVNIIATTLPPELLNYQGIVLRTRQHIQERQFTTFLLFLRKSDDLLCCSS